MLSLVCTQSEEKGGLQATHFHILNLPVARVRFRVCMSQRGWATSRNYPDSVAWHLEAKVPLNSFLRRSAVQLGHESLFWTAMTLRRKNVFKQQHTEHKSIRFRMNPVVVQSQLGPLILERTKYYCLNVPREMSLVKYAMNGDCKVVRIQPVHVRTPWNMQLNQFYQWQ